MCVKWVSREGACICVGCVCAVCTVVCVYIVTFV